MEDMIIFDEASEMSFSWFIRYAPESYKEEIYKKVVEDVIEAQEKYTGKK